MFNIKKKSLALMVTWLLVMVFGQSAVADSTAVLPQGRSSVSLSYFQDPITREFDNSGQDRELGYFFNEIDVTPIGIPIFNQVFGLPPGTASLQRAMIFENSRIDLEGMIFSYGYGITDDLSFGIGFPYFMKARTSVEFEALAWPDTSLPFPLPPGPLDMTPYAQEFIKTNLGYENVKDWAGEPGIGDIRLGLKYRFLNQETVKMATSLFGVIPTGRVDDEKVLTDVRYGKGHTDIGIAGMVDFTPVEPVTINFTGRYAYTFPYHRAIFMQDPSSPLYKYELATKREFGDYDTGDYYELESEVRLNLADAGHLFGGYNYHQAWESRIDGDRVPRSEVISRSVFYGLSADTTKAFLNKEADIPVILTISRETVLSGKNTVKDNRTTLGMQFLF